MRLLFFAERLWLMPGGAERWAECYAAALAARGVEIVLVTGVLEHAQVEQIHGFTVHRLPLTQALASGTAAQWQAIARYMDAILHDFRPDILHFNLDGAAAFLIPMAKARSAAPIVATLHSAVEQMASPLVRAAGMVNRLTCGSAYARDWVHAHWPHMDNRCTMIPLAMPRPFAAGGPATDQPLRLACVGRHSDEKGYDIALRAFASVLLRHPDSRLALGGAGPQTDELKAGAHTLGIADKVDFPGWIAQPDIGAFLTGASLILTPSRQEMFGLAALEAAWAGRAVVATHVGGLPEVIEDGVTGQLCAPENPDAMARAILDLAERPGALAAMGQMAFGAVQKRFCWDNHVLAYLQLLGDLIGNTSAT